MVRPFIYGSRFNTSIIDLNETTILLRQALNFLAHVAYRGGIIMYIVRQPQLVHMVEKAAVDIGEYAHCRSSFARCCCLFSYQRWASLYPAPGNYRLCKNGH